MTVFRIEREKYLKTTLKGIGAALSEGFRWNSRNTHLVYTAESRALAILEIAVHLDLSEDLPADRFIVKIDIPDRIQIIEIKNEDLPNNWNAKPPALETQYIGDDFVREKQAAVLKVPSSVVHEEFNYLLNPNHPDAAEIKVISANPFHFDSRLQSTIKTKEK
jgi:RES domain-containing protein